MGRDKARDDKFVNCSQESELVYISSLYERSFDVLIFLRRECNYGNLKYSTHREVYDLISRKLGYPMPN
ncbi:MAG: hypothetical protein AB7O73_03950 [Bacteroidia bacterium]